MRLVAQRFAHEPLSPAGSLMIGGRFNIGNDVNATRFIPFPALYTGSDFQTAYCELHQIGHGETLGGLTAEELRVSEHPWSQFPVRGRLSNVFDLASDVAVHSLCRVFSKFSIPREVAKAARQVGVNPPAIVRTAQQLRKTVMAENWRALPSQFSLPANSQILGRLMQEAGCEAIRYPSDKYPSGYCLGVFTRGLAADTSYLEIKGDCGPFAQHTRIDSTASSLW